jgi:hypothetical protein
MQASYLIALVFYVLRGYLTSIAVETPVLCVGLSPRHSMKKRVFAGIWLTACSYPIVTLTLPCLMQPGTLPYLAVAETFAPIVECMIFWMMFGSREEFGKRSMYRDFAVIILANLCSFGLGVVAPAIMRW